MSAIDLSLDRLQALLPHLPLPYTRPTVHIAGTNGKGSVSALTASILAQSTRLVGRFNSPHLVHITDSILIGNAPVSPASYLSARASVQRANDEHHAGLTSFEILTLTALQLFEASRVDVAVVEVGLGGRLDATNAIPSDCILVSALTAVDFDHQRFLGNTLSAIATEKAGIARAGKPFVFGPQKDENKEEVGDAVRKTVGQIGADIVPPVVTVVVSTEAAVEPTEALFTPPPGTTVQMTIPAVSAEPIRAILPLHGAHQLDNLTTALTILQTLLTHPSCTATRQARGGPDLIVTPVTLQQGVQNVEWRGRLSWHVYPAPSSSFPPLTVLVDGAHNPASSCTLAAYIQHLLRGAPSTGKKAHITYILGLSSSPPKTPKETISPLFENTSGSPQISLAFVPFTPPTGMPWVQHVPPQDLADVVQDIFSSAPLSPAALWLPWSPISPLEEGQANSYLRDALSWAQTQKGDAEDHLVVVAGSLYLVADFYRLLNS